MNPDIKWLSICNAHHAVDVDCDMCMLGFWYDIKSDMVTYRSTDQKHEGEAFWKGLAEHFNITSKPVKEPTPNTEFTY